MSLLSTPSWSETFDDLVEREGIYYQKFSDVPYTAEVTGDEQGSLKNGKRDGAWIGYYENGELYYKGNYKDGKKESVWVSYNRDGTLYKYYTGTFKDDKKISD